MPPIALEDLVVEYRRLQQLAAARGEGPGRVTTMGWDLEYVSLGALCEFLDQVLYRRLNDFVPEGTRPVILDCGANIGYTVLNYKRLFPGARITALEPDPQFAPVLRRNLARNQAADVKVVEAAAWTTDGRARWMMEGRDGSRIANDLPGAAPHAEVTTVDLARYLEQDVDLLKLDIEGAEFEVVPHLAAHLSRVRNILVECHIVDQSKYAGLARILTTLAGAGFKISLNSTGPWRDLTRRHKPAALHAEQYLSVVGWRTEAAAVSRDETYAPYLGLSHYCRLLEPADDLRRALTGLLTEPESWGLHHVTGPFQREQGLCWTWRFPGASAPVGDSPACSDSHTILLEDDRVLGPGHTAHDDIRTHGAGRYSHWGPFLYLAASDNSNPNTNGRRYAVICRRPGPGRSGPANATR